VKSSPEPAAVEGWADHDVQARSRGFEAYEKTQHLVANQLVEIDGDRASGETYCTAHHIYRVDGAPMNLTMFIRYQDRWLREGGRWWFEQRRLFVDWERRAPLGDEGWA
jgi:hypothetical protein